MAPTTDPAPRHVPHTVGDVMTTRPDVIVATASVPDAIAEMLSDGTRHLPVVDDAGRVLGMLSDRDVRSAVGRPLDAFASEDPPPEVAGKTVYDIMTPAPLCCRPEDSLERVVSIFVEHRFGAMPVIESDRTLVGIVSYVDLLRAFGTILAERRRERA